jgi:diguanylate cyclase
MLRKRISMRVVLILTIMVMGGLAMTMPLWGGSVFRDVVVETQEAALSSHLRNVALNLRRDYESEARELVWLLQHDPEFADALARRRASAIDSHFASLFGGPSLFVADVGVIRLALLNEKFDVVVQRSRNPANPTPGLDACGSLRATAARRAAQLQAQPAYELCVADKHLFQTIIIPVGGANDASYLELVGDFGAVLRGIENTLALPLRLVLPDGTVAYQSARWPETAALGHYILGEVPVNGLPGGANARIAAYMDMSSLNERFDQAKYAFVFLAGIVTVAVMLLAFYFVQQTALAPLRALSERLSGVHQDKTQLGELVQVRGSAETAELGASFNRMTTRLKELYEGLQRAAFTDPLTQLPNRTLFHDRLEQSILTARRENKTFALFIMDLDRFKDINDTLGHQVGDEVLKLVAQRLRAKLRESDTIARMGGDEFAVLLPTVNAKYAGMAARMLLQALRAPFEVNGQSLDVGASIGIALYPDNGVDANVLVQRADVAMYAAKHTNTGHAFYETSLDDNHPGRLSLMGELRRAVEQEQFVLHFQPIVDLAAGKVAAVEALLRWNHPQNGMVPPDEFVPLLEQTGLIRSLTPWVLNESMRVARSLRSQGMPVVVSANLSVRDVQDPFLADTLAEQLAANDVRPEWIKLEITESAVMTDPERALAMLRHLARMGLGLAIDDFGTGYSSLTYLKRLPVSTIKVDKSFVVGMARDTDDAAIVRTSIDLARNLGLEFVAEGVESEEILNRLEEFGCHMVQGLYLSRPLTEEELNVWLRQSFWGLRSSAGPNARPPRPN